jgi:predicted glycosyltransferase
MPVSGKFPYRLTELLAKYGSKARVNDELFKVALAEIDWVISQQTRKGHGVEADDALNLLRDELRDQCRLYLEELRDFKWHDSDTKEERNCSRPLSEFYHLFAIEAFIARQGE